MLRHPFPAFLLGVLLALSGCERPSDLYSVDASAGDPLPTDPTTPAAPLDAEPAPRAARASCVANTQCDSKVCTLANQCADPTAVALVQTDSTGDCLSSACGSITQAIKTGRPYVLLLTAGLAARHNETIDIAARKVTLVGYEGTNVVRAADASSPTLTVRAGADVTVQNILFTSGGQQAAQCLDVREAKLMLDRTILNSCAGLGIRATNAELRMRGSTVAGCGGGVLAQHSAVHIERSDLALNTKSPALAFRDEGVASGTVPTPGLIVQNALIVENAQGVDVFTKYPVVFTNTTIANNKANPLRCSLAALEAAKPKFVASIIATLTGQQPSSYCDVSTSRVIGYPSDDFQPNNYALRRSSSLVDSLPAPCTLTEDYFKLKRPQGGGCDYGALEALR